MKHVNSSIKNLPTREKFYFMNTVWFILQKPIASLWKGIKAACWKKLCAKLFGFNKTEIDLDDRGRRLMRDPTRYDGVGDRLSWSTWGHLDVTKRIIPEPILSHRIACIAFSCMQYLHRQDPNNHPNQDNLHATWAMKSKQSPWLWRQRIRSISTGHQRPTLDGDVPKYSFSQSLRRSHQMLYSEGIQSEKFYQERYIFYIWTLNLLYHTLSTAMKSDELTKALLKPFIPSVACILFPRHVKRLQKAVSAYLKKVD